MVAIVFRLLQYPHSRYCTHHTILTTLWFSGFDSPQMYSDGDYDLAGFSVGAVKKSGLLPREGERGVRPGCVLLGVASSGLHSNGFSLVRKVNCNYGSFVLCQKWRIAPHPPHTPLHLHEFVCCVLQSFASLLVARWCVTTVSATANHAPSHQLGLQLVTLW